jgi:uncharacterized protein (TIGR02757 family)
MTILDLKSFLDEKAYYYNQPVFIETDPLQIPHQFSLKEDIEIAGLLSATIAWGNRKMIIQNAQRMMNLMGNSPYDFVLCHQEKDLIPLESFVHRTFNGVDFISFIKGLQHIYRNCGGLETVFAQHVQDNYLHHSIHHFKQRLFEVPHAARSHKHVADPLAGSAAKRLHLFLRWMVRNDQTGVDLGIWKNISPSALSCPLDVHSGKVARKLGLLTRSQNDFKAVQELDLNLRKLDPLDPVKYDFALFGLGVFEGF